MIALSRRRLLAAAAASALWPRPAGAQPEIDHTALAARATAWILPAFEALAEAAAAFSDQAAAETGAAGRPDLEAAYHEVFDAWCRVGHLRMGPLEEEGRVFGVAFWPDTRGRTQRAIDDLVRAEDPIVDDAAAFGGGSVAARGLFAVDYLMFDPDAAPIDGYRQRLLAAIARDLAATTATVAARWRDPYADLFATAGAPDHPLFRSRAEATLEIFQALNDGLEFNADVRLARPLGTFERPRPRRAEAWRSGRPLRNLVVSMRALRSYASEAFAPALSAADAAAVDERFAQAVAAAEAAPAPMVDAVRDPGERIRIEALKNRITTARRVVVERIGGAVGAGVTFNSLDGD